MLHSVYVPKLSKYKAASMSNSTHQVKRLILKFKQKPNIVRITNLLVKKEMTIKMQISGYLHSKQLNIKDLTN